MSATTVFVITTAITSGITLILSILDRVQRSSCRNGTFDVEFRDDRRTSQPIIHVHAVSTAHSDDDDMKATAIDRTTDLRWAEFKQQQVKLDRRISSLR